MARRPGFVAKSGSTAVSADRRLAGFSTASWQAPRDRRAGPAALLADLATHARGEAEMADVAARLEDQLVELQPAVAQLSGAFERRQHLMAEVAGEAFGMIRV